MFRLVENTLTSFCKHHTATNKRISISRLAIKLCFWSLLKKIHRISAQKSQLSFIALELVESDLVHTNFGVSSTTTQKTSDVTVNPLLRGLIYFQPIWGGGGLFNLKTTVVSVLHKELEYKVEKLKYKKF